MRRLQTGIRFACQHSVLILFILLFAGIGGYFILHSFAASTANVWISTTGNDSTCVRGDQTKPCATFQQACTIAQAGDVVEVAAGTYPEPNSAGKYIDGDCSHGLGADVNPNAAEQGVTTGTTANWVTFDCAPGATARSVSFGLEGDAFWGNEHAIFDGGPNQCFYFPYLVAGAGGSTQITRNVQFKNAWTGGYEVAGAENILFADSQIGPSIKCASTDTGLASQYQCNPAGPWYEAQYANWNPNGYTAANCSANHVNCGGDTDVMNEPYFHVNNNGHEPANIRWENVWDHDQQAKNAGWWHPGGLLTNGTGIASDYNVVLDRVKMERIAVQGIQNEMSGFTVENSVFACPTYPLDDTTDNPSGLWSLCASGQGNITFSAGISVSNMIVRYNTFLPNQSAFIWRTGTNSYTTTRMIGNLGTGGMSAVPAGSGNVTDYNVSYSGASAVGANGSSIAGNPITDSDPGTAYSDTTQIDASLTGSPAVSTVPNSGPDYNLVYDYLNNSRSYPTSAGAYQYGASGGVVGDLNGDNHVNIFDLSIFLSHWQQTGTGLPEDFNNDGVVNIFDLSILLSHYGA